MLGNTLFSYLVHEGKHEVLGTLRGDASKKHFPADCAQRLQAGVDVDDLASVERCITAFSPEVVINCIGVVKQLASAKDPLTVVPINTLLPHQLVKICGPSTRVVHISTDCVFSGRDGGYVEEDFPDADDLYGRTKLLGELHEGNAITLRTSIIGHELESTTGLVEWFLSQTGETNGFGSAYFSGLTTVELSRVICKHVLPAPNLTGLFQVSVDRISKYDLLKLVAEIYGKEIVIHRDDNLQIDRSLNSDKFRKVADYSPPQWQQMIQQMKEFRDQTRNSDA